MEERLQKIMARHNLGSRRDCEVIIQEGRVKVNGQVVRLGDKADAGIDRIEVDGKALPKNSPDKVYFALNKPQGVLSDDDDTENRPTVFQFVPYEGHLFSVGRLDFDSEGLILLTNDGELANHLTHPRYGHEKEYMVLVGREPDTKQLGAWRRGVVLPEDGERTQPAKVFVDKKAAGNNVWLRIVMSEGKKRQIRKVGAAIGLPVLRIVRVRIGSLELGNLKEGKWRALTGSEVNSLQQLTMHASVKKPINPRRFTTKKNKNRAAN
jgi:23S rRNA pseudouridine2605 synthase